MFNFIESNFSKLPDAMETMIQKETSHIFSKIVDFDSFFDYIGMPRRTLEEYNKMLKTACKNSKLKKYHGTVDEIAEMPKKED